MSTDQPTTHVSPDPGVAEFDDALSRAFAKVERAIPDGVDRNIKKDGKDRRYVTLASVDAACRDALTAEGFSYPQLATTSPTPDGGLWLTVTTHLRRKGVALVTTLGLPVLGQMRKGGEGFAQPTAQSVGSALTYGRRYALTALLGVCPDDDDDGHAASHRDPALDRLHDLTGRLARARKVDYQVAQDLVCTAADTWPSGSPTTKQVAALTAAALLLLEQRDTPPPKAAPTDYEIAMEAFATAGKAYRENQEAEYLDTECRSPSKAVIEGIRSKALKIACKAAGVDQWPGAAATVEQLQAAAKALEDALAAEQEPTPREAWRAAQNAYIDAMANDYQREEGQEPDADVLAGITSDTLVLSAKAVGAKKWPARPSDEQLATAATALREAAEAVRS